MMNDEKLNKQMEAEREEREFEIGILYPVKRAFSKKDDKLLATLWINEAGTFQVTSGFLGYTPRDVSYKVACEEFENALAEADYYLCLKGNYYIIVESKEFK